MNTAGTGLDPTNIWVGSDGGAFQSTSSGAAGSFQPRNQGLAVTQFAYLAQRADTDAVAFAGAQDNGTPRILGEQASLETAGGDGGGVAIDPGNPYRVMRQYVRAYLDVSTDGGATWPGALFPPASNATERGSTGFVAPLRAAAAGSTSLAVFGTNRLWLTTDWGTTWVTLPTNTNPYSSSPPNLTQDVIDNSPVRAIAFASTTRIYAATPGTVWRYDATGSTWTKTVLPTTGLPSFFFITALAPDLDPSAAPGSLYATLGSAGSAHLYYFNGTSWQAAMPTTVVDVPAHAVVVDPVAPINVYVGTDVGVFKGVKSGGTWSWSLFSQGLPESAVTDLGVFAAAPPARLLRAATHGRSVWEVDLAATTGFDPDIYLRVNYADSGRQLPSGQRYPWVEGALDPTHVGYQLYHWMSADIEVRRSSLSGLPALGSPVSYLDFAVNIGDYVDTTTHMETGDVSGIDKVYVEVHNRSLNAVPAAQPRVLLLWADASLALPPLPTNWASHINAGDTGTSWIAGSNWNFVNTATPYQSLTRDLDVRTPQVVEFDLDFSTLGLAAGHDHVCLAAFVTTTGDTITSVLTDLNQVTMSDKHVAHRNVHLVALGSTPGTSPGDGGSSPGETVVIDVYNPTDRAAAFDLVFDRRYFLGKNKAPGHVSVLLPHLTAPVPTGFRVEQRNALTGQLRGILGEWLERLGNELSNLGDAIEGDVVEVVVRRREIRRKKLDALDRTRVFVADDTTSAPTISGVPIPANGRITLALTLHAPADAKVGDKFRFDVLQKDATGKLLGGSTYVVAVIKLLANR